MCKTNLDNEGVKIGHSEGTLSDVSGECTEIDWSHPEKKVIKYVEYNTVRKYSKSSTINVRIQLINEKVKRIYNVSSCDASTHLIAAPGQHAGTRPG